MNNLEEIICVCRNNEYAVYADEFNELKVLRDIEHIVDVGDICMNKNMLQPFEMLNERIKQELINLL